MTGWGGGRKERGGRGAQAIIQHCLELEKPPKVARKTQGHGKCLAGSKSSFMLIGSNLRTISTIITFCNFTCRVGKMPSRKAYLLTWPMDTRMIL